VVAVDERQSKPLESTVVLATALADETRLNSLGIRRQQHILPRLDWFSSSRAAPAEVNGGGKAGVAAQARVV
jgi:hypothetical protein